MAGGDWCGFPELVVNQTVDLEPQLCVYQVKPLQFILNPIQLRRFPGGTGAERSSLSKCSLIAQVFGHQLGTGYNSSSDSITNAAAASSNRFDLFVRTVDSERSRKTRSPSQEVLADLNDGRWGSFAGVSGVGREHKKLPCS